MYTESHPRPPASPSNSFKTSPSQDFFFPPTLRPNKSFKCNTYGSPRKCCKQKTYGPANPFRCNTYKNTGGASLGLNIPTFQPSTFQRLWLTLSPIFRTLFQVPYPVSPLLATLTKTAGVCTNNSHYGTHPPPFSISYPLLSTAYEMSILQLLSFHIPACNGCMGRLRTFQPSNVQRANCFFTYPFFSIRCALFCSFLHSRKTQLYSFQAIPHSLQKNRGCGGATYLAHSSCPDPVGALRGEGTHLSLENYMENVIALASGVKNETGQTFPCPKAEPGEVCPG